MQFDTEDQVLFLMFSHYFCLIVCEDHKEVSLMYPEALFEIGWVKCRVILWYKWLNGQEIKF